ncbi:trypsin alpha-4-like [Anopheles aquasalis]|uniref:trypsin alpha-4-like n=1 Tax=Anopheles aquasalis TaxID=42839 RepID=UPI00215A215E|nr:trypsin alpha-4-like [Anopheles aquasalis]
MKQSARLILLVLSLVLVGGHFAKGQQDESEEVDADSTIDVDEQNGTNQPSRVGRLIGGVPVTSANQPYLAEMNLISDKRYFCIGAVINSTTVLTSASALRSAGNITSILVNVGSNPSFAASRLFYFVSYALHSGFNPTTLENDVAIITINGTFAGVPNVNPIAIATTEIAVSTTNRTQCLVLGWTETGASYDMLQATYELMTDQECAAGGANPPSIMCAKPTGGYACYFDGGAPLVCNGQLYGVLTAQTNCTSSNPPTFQKFAKLPLISIPWGPATISTSNATVATLPRKNYVSCP